MRALWCVPELERGYTTAQEDMRGVYVSMVYYHVVCGQAREMMAINVSRRDRIIDMTFFWPWRMMVFCMYSWFLDDELERSSGAQWHPTLCSSP